MKSPSWLFLVALILACTASGGVKGVPLWAYPAPAFPNATPPSDESPQHVPNSSLTFTLRQTQDPHNVVDWHPDDHPPAPPVVLHGHEGGLEACAHCHLPNGMGSEILQAPTLTGLPASYIIQQAADFKSGARRSSDNYMASRLMQYVLKFADDADIQAAADYFASLHPRSWIRVVETPVVPRTKVVDMMYVPIDDGGTEPIGKRIVEVPEDIERTELRDSESGYIAYVPPGSIKRGKRLVITGGKGKTIACATCHGHDLRGLNSVPPIAGRSPTYIVRQLYDIQRGARAGAKAAPMAQVVAKLSVDDMLAIAAYTASLPP